jgi:flagellar protein FliJ
MKPKSKRLQLVCDLAARKEEQALDHLRQARRALDVQQQQLDDLKNYHQQYLHSMKQALKGQVDIQKLQVFQGFVAQIQAAIEQQQSVVARAQQLFERSSQVWQRCHQKRKSYEDLVTQYRQQEQALADKKLEKRIEDDFLTRQRFRR